MTRSFSLGGILCVIAKRFFGWFYFYEGYELLKFMVGERHLGKVDLLEVWLQAAASLLEQHPQLRSIEMPDWFVNDTELERWLSSQMNLYGRDLPVKPLSHLTDPDQIPDFNAAYVNKALEEVTSQADKIRTDVWINEAARYKIGDEVAGQISKLGFFGAFVRLNAVLEGFAHISQLGNLVELGQDSLQGFVGQTMTFKIAGIDLEHHRISLQLKEEA